MLDQSPFTFLCPVRRKRGRKFAMTSLLQKCLRCWHVSNLLIMFHSPPANWAEAAYWSISHTGGFSLVSDVTRCGWEAEATLPINNNCKEESILIAMNLRTASSYLETANSDEPESQVFSSSFLMLYKSCYTHPSKLNNDWLYWSTHHLMIPLCLDNPVI